jgi:two-component system response regulator
VRDGAEAVDFLFATGPYAGRNVRNSPKVVLLDLKLPKVNGIEVLKQIRSHPDTKRIPVVALTSSHEDRDLRACYELGINSYIVKPVDFGQFTEAVRQLGSYWLLLNQTPAPVPVEACV